ncbi:MAG TPA: hypothetical protein VF653_01885, partial [Methylomirabilota bacterium]
DTQRYLNVYINGHDKGLAYALLPGIFTGTAEDRVVLNWAAVGPDAPIGPPYNLGRALSHEVGHYFGLDDETMDGIEHES